MGHSVSIVLQVLLLLLTVAPALANELPHSRGASAPLLVELAGLNPRWMPVVDSPTAPSIDTKMAENSRLNLAAGLQKTPLTILAKDFKLEGLPIVTLWKGPRDRVAIGVNQRGIPGIWYSRRTRAEQRSELSYAK